MFGDTEIVQFLNQKGVKSASFISSYEDLERACWRKSNLGAKGATSIVSSSDRGVDVHSSNFLPIDAHQPMFCATCDASTSLIAPVKDWTWRLPPLVSIIGGSPCTIDRISPAMIDALCPECYGKRSECDGSMADLSWRRFHADAVADNIIIMSVLDREVLDLSDLISAITSEAKPVTDSVKS